MKAGDRVKIKVTVTDNPFTTNKLTGKIIIIDTDETIGVEVDNGGGEGHAFPIAGYPINNNNGWWFMEHEVTKEDTND